MVSTVHSKQKLAYRVLGVLGDRQARWWQKGFLIVSLLAGGALGSAYALSPVEPTVFFPDAVPVIGVLDDYVVMACLFIPMMKAFRGIYGDMSTTRWEKAFLTLGAGYTLWPADLVADFIPVAGMMDDLGVVASMFVPVLLRAVMSILQSAASYFTGYQSRSRTA